MQTDGKILVASDEGVFRCNVDGTRDRTFAAGGYTHIPNPRNNTTRVSGLAVQPSGKIVVSVVEFSPPSYPNSTEAISLVQLNSDGTLDRLFGDEGWSTDSIVRPTYTSGSLARQPDGAIVRVVDLCPLDGPCKSPTSVLRRYRPDGTVDDAFGENGIARLPLDAKVRVLKTLPDGKLLVAAQLQTSSGSPTGSRIFRYTANGVVDASFSEVLSPPSTSPALGLSGPLVLNDIAVAPDGGLLVAGGEGPVVSRYIAGSTAAIEYYNAALDHYFISANPIEVQVVDSGVFKGWERTGQMFYVHGSRIAAPSDHVPVCRFYIPPDSDSHFFSASPAECDALNQQPNRDAGVIKVSDSAFFVALPDADTGTCPANTLPVYRLWNRRPDSNHRYTTDRAVRDQMIARGYAAEGYGPDGVAMCAATAD